MLRPLENRYPVPAAEAIDRHVGIIVLGGALGHPDSFVAHGLIVITAFISPFRAEREMARELIGADHFAQVYVSTPLAVCEARDVKGLYKQARAGKIPNMTGVNSPYEAPHDFAFEANASTDSVADIVRGLVALV